jgi:hypothetical protein
VEREREKEREESADERPRRWRRGSGEKEAYRMPLEQVEHAPVLALDKGLNELAHVWLVVDEPPEALILKHL